MVKSTYYCLLKRLKKCCGGRRPTQKNIEDAMDDMGLPDDYEVDVEQLILDLSTFSPKQKDVELATIKRVTKKYDEMAYAAVALDATEHSSHDLRHHSNAETLRQENKFLMNRLDVIADRSPSR